MEEGDTQSVVEDAPACLRLHSYLYHLFRRSSFRLGGDPDRRVPRARHGLHLKKEFHFILRPNDLLRIGSCPLGNGHPPPPSRLSQNGWVFNAHHHNRRIELKQRVHEKCISFDWKLCQVRHSYLQIGHYSSTPIVSHLYKKDFCSNKPPALTARDATGSQGIKKKTPFFQSGRSEKEKSSVALECKLRATTLSINSHQQKPCRRRRKQQERRGFV